MRSAQLTYCIRSRVCGTCAGRVCTCKVALHARRCLYNSCLVNDEITTAPVLSRNDGKRTLGKIRFPHTMHAYNSTHASCTCSVTTDVRQRFVLLYSLELECHTSSKSLVTRYVRYGPLASTWFLCGLEQEIPVADGLYTVHVIQPYPYKHLIHIQSVRK